MPEYGLVGSGKESKKKEKSYMERWAHLYNTLLREDEKIEVTQKDVGIIRSLAAFIDSYNNREGKEIYIIFCGGDEEISKTRYIGAYYQCQNAKHLLDVLKEDNEELEDMYWFITGLEIDRRIKIIKGKNTKEKINNTVKQLYISKLLSKENKMKVVAETGYRNRIRYEIFDELSGYDKSKGWVVEQVEPYELVRNELLPLLKEKHKKIFEEVFERPKRESLRERIIQILDWFYLIPIMLSY